MNQPKKFAGSDIAWDEAHNKLLALCNQSLADQAAIRVARLPIGQRVYNIFLLLSNISSLTIFSPVVILIKMTVESNILHAVFFFF